jgi:hypothetical protein
MDPEPSEPDAPTPDSEDEFFKWVARRSKEIAAERLAEIQARELVDP